MDANLLICTVGLPRSGKSTWAIQQGLPIVNPDAIRLAIHGRRFWAPAETQVWAVTDLMIRSMFLAGHSTIVLDATSIERRNRNERQCRTQDDTQPRWRTEFIVFDTSAEVCKQRALATDMPDLVDVIEMMAARLDPLGPGETVYGRTT